MRVIPETQIMLKLMGINTVREERLGNARDAVAVAHHSYCDRFQLGTMAYVLSDTGELLCGTPKYATPMNYFAHLPSNSPVASLEQLKETSLLTSRYAAELPALIKQMETNGQSYAVLTRYRRWLPLNNGDKVYRDFAPEVIFELTKNGILIDFTKPHSQPKPPTNRSPRPRGRGKAPQ